jgi:hypothetical protein
MRTEASTAARLELSPPWKFGDLLELPGVRERWEKVRQYFFLRESTYDMTSVCNMDCEGCYYFQGEKQHTVSETSPEAWRALMLEERARGITYVVLAGAEPSIVPRLLEACHEVIPLGTVATNGLKRIPPEIGYRLHVSTWGNDATSYRVRRSKRTLERQLANYADDERAVFVYTFTRQNVGEAAEVAEQLAAAGARLTFNMFSAPIGYDGPLRHTAESLEDVRSTMASLMERFPDNVLFSPYSLVAHTSSLSLHDMFGCTYPRRNPSAVVGLGKSFRQYRTDLSWDREAACCVPDTDCADCRHYAAGSAIVTARLLRHATRPETFRAWLDYVDTYLAIWVSGYEKGPNLCPEPVAPPAFEPSEAAR